MKILNPINEIVTKKPLVAVAGIVLITMIMMTISIVKPQEEGMDDRAWLPEDETLKALDDIEDSFPSQTKSVVVLVHADQDDTQNDDDDSDNNGNAENDMNDEPNVITTSFMIELLEMEWAISNDTLVSDSLSTEQGFVSIPHLIAPLIDPSAVTFPELIELFSTITDTELQEYFTLAQTIPELGTFVTSLVSTDIRDHPTQVDSTIMLVGLNTALLPGESADDRDERIIDTEERIDKIVVKQDSTYLKPMVISDSKVNQESIDADEETLATLLPLAFGFIIVILLITYRSISDVAISLMALIFTLIWIQGFNSMMGFTPSGLGSIVPILMVGLGVDYGIHITMRYREKLVKDSNITKAASISILSAGAALLLAAFTDMVGFLSNSTSSIEPLKEFGVTVAVGIFAAYIIYVTFVPASRIILDRRQQAKGKALLSPANAARALKKKDELTGMKARTAKVMDLGASVAIARPKTALMVIGAITLVMLLMATQVTSSFNMTDFLAQGTDLTEEINYMDENFEFSDETAIVYIKGDDLAKPEVLTAMDATHKNLAERDGSMILYRGGRGLSSPLLIMQDLADNSDVEQGGLYDPDFAALYSESDVDQDGVPEENIQALLDHLKFQYPDLVADSLLLNEETGKYTIMLMTIKVNTDSMEKAGDVHKILKKETAPLEALEADGTIDRSVVSGEPILMDVMLTTINESMIMSILITIVISALVVTFVFYYSSGSKALGLITILPVVLVLVWIMGSMFLLGMHLNVLTIIIGAITIGLGITYAIHVTHRFTEELEEHGDIDKAVHNTVIHTGNALFGAALTTMVGFGILALSPQVPMQQFGSLTALTILYSYTFSVYVQPSLLVLWARATAVADMPHPLSRKQDNPVPTTPRPSPGVTLVRSVRQALSVFGIFMVWFGERKLINDKPSEGSTSGETKGNKKEAM